MINENKKIVDNEKWNKNFQLLCSYKEKFGSCDMKLKYVYKGFRLGSWCQRQRQFYKNKSNCLTEDRIDRLNSIGFDWYINSHEDKWDKNFQILCEYKEEFGTCYMKSNCEYKGVNLGSWCSRQRHNYNIYKLSNEKINKLNSIGFIWDVMKYDWDINFNLLCDYKNKYKTTNVPLNYITEDGVKLGLWVETQRKALRGVVTVNLDYYKLHKLNSINFIWNNDIWYKGYTLMLEYKEKYGHCLYLTTNRNDFHKSKQLMNWVCNQRTRYKNGYLSKEKIELLEKIDFIWAVEEDEDRWNNFFNVLKSYKREFGNCDVPNDLKYNGYSLGNWVNSQRVLYYYGKLNDYRARLLNIIGFNFNSKELYSKNNK